MTAAPAAHGGEGASVAVLEGLFRSVAVVDGVTDARSTGGGIAMDEEVVGLDGPGTMGAAAARPLFGVVRTGAGV